MSTARGMTPIPPFIEDAHPLTTGEVQAARRLIDARALDEDDRSYLMAALGIAPSGDEPDAA